VTAIAFNERLDAGDIVAHDLFPLTGRESELELREVHFLALVELLQKLPERMDALQSTDFRRQDLSRGTY
jgi:methionyl-tRNA formyltransferase